MWTLPTTDISKADQLKAILKEFGDLVEWVVIGQEKHEDGQLHLHCAIKFIRLIRRQVKLYGDIKPQRKIGGGDAGLVKYVTKEDTEPLAWNCTPADIIAASAKHQALSRYELMAGIRDGKITSMDQAWDQAPDIAGFHSAAVQSAISRFQTQTPVSDIVRFDQGPSEHKAPSLVLDWFSSPVDKVCFFCFMSRFCIFGATLGVARLGSLRP